MTTASCKTCSVPPSRSSDSWIKWISSDSLADAKTQSAILHQFLLIGEIAKRLSDDFKSTHASMPWSAMARMRDKLIHHYRGVDLREIFKAADVEIPRLIAFLRRQLLGGE